MLAAMIVLVTINQFLSMIPYALQLTANVMIKRSLHLPDQAILNCIINAVTSTALCLICSSLLFFNRAHIVTLFTEDGEVSQIVEDAFQAFIIGFSFDWMQCCAYGMLSGAGATDTYELSLSKLSLTFVSLVSSWYFTVRQDFGIVGLWLGLAANSLILAILNYGMLILYIDWWRIEEC